MSLETSHENYIRELIEEIEILDPVQSKYTIRLLGKELTRVQKKAELKARHDETGRQDFVKLTRKIMVPIDKYPCYNFIGKLMGPKATNIKRIQQETGSSVLILGQGSTRDKEKEKMLAESGDPKFAHFKEPLHISIHVKGVKSKAEAQLVAAVNEVEKYMDPNNDEIKMQSQRTMFGGTPGVVAPIIRVGVPPPDAIMLSKGSSSSSGYKPRSAAEYTYDASFDGSYEGYPSTGPPTKTNPSDTLVLEPYDKKLGPPPIPRNPLKRVLTPSSTSESSDEDGPAPSARHQHKKPAMTVGNMFRRAYDSEDSDDDEDD